MSPRTNILHLLLLALFALPLSAGAWPAATPYVPIESDVYEDLDLLVAHGLVKSAIQGQKPFSRAAISGFIAEARLNYAVWERSAASGPAARDFVRRLLERLEKEYPPHSAAGRRASSPLYELYFLESLMFELTALDSPSRPYAGPTQLDARFNPLVAEREGRHLPDGAAQSWESSHWARIGRHFSGYARPRFQFQLANHQDPEENAAFIQELYGSVAFFNTQLDFGRKAAQWGQSRYGGIILSNNARPMDGIQLSNPRPWRIGPLGLLKYNFIFSNLGPEQRLKNPYFTALKLSFKPASFFEFGIARALIFGGEGSPPASAADTFAETFGFRSSANRSNSINGFEIRASLPALRNISLYGEAYFDDFNSAHILRSFRDDAGFLAGIHMPRVDRAGRYGLRLEGRKNSTILYKHGTWVSGWSLNGRTLGDHLGPDAESFRIEGLARLGDWRLGHAFVFERIDSDLYESDPSYGRRVNTNNPSEKRYRVTADLSHPLARGLRLKALAGFERVNGFNFVPGDDRNNYLWITRLEWEPDRAARISRATR